MKKFTTTALMLLPAAAIFAQTGTFSVKGTVASTAPAKAFLMYTVDKQPVTDSTDVVNGTFEFKGTLAAPIMGRILVAHAGETMGALRKMRTKLDGLSLYLEPGNTQLKTADSVSKATISGSPLNADNAKLIASLKPLNEKMTALYAEERAAGKDPAADVTAAFDKREETLDAERKVIVGNFIKANPASLVSLNNLSGYLGAYPEASDLEPIFNVLSPALKATPQGKAYAERIPKLKLVAMGATAPEFAQADKDGKMISLSSFRGKFVLIDFWASWCGPCRAENPNVVKAYNQFKDKNFTILGVSLDQPKGRDAWLAAIEKDGLVWTQVTDLQYWKNEVSTMYGVQAIPQNFLLDPNGKIIGKNLRGAALVNKLAQVTGSGKTATTSDTKTR